MARDRRTADQTTAQHLAAVRRLNAALAIESSSAGNAVGLLLGIGLCVVVGVVLLLAQAGPSERAYGTVLALSLEETDHGSFPLARVQVGEREALVSLPRGLPCRVGDRIALERRKALLGYRHQIAPEGCASS